MRITLEDGPFGTFVIRSEDGRSQLVQTDWDYPGVATAFGWVSCPWGDTNGTVDCDHRCAHEMIQDAYSFLSERVGESVEDPGYF
jgi:hypothetical protein